MKTDKKWIAIWFEDKKPRTKSFAISKYEDEEAKNLAINFHRQKYEEIINI